MIKLDVNQSKEIDKKAQEKYGISGIVLMENAGLRAYDIAIGLLKKRKSKNVIIFCGPGNNGGDGFVVARHLLNNNIKVQVFLLVDSKNIKGDALVNYQILQKIGAEIVILSQANFLKKTSMVLNKAGLIIDAIFGIGLNKEVTGFIKKVITEINGSASPVLSLDVPSGLCASSGKVFGCCIKAHTTATFGVAKKGFYKGQGVIQCGDIKVVDISLPKDLFKK